MAGSKDKNSVSNGSQRKDKKKKGKEAIEALTDSIKSMEPDQQMATLLSKYAELADENRQLQATIATHDKMVSQIQKEKDKVDQDYTKAVLSRSKLESLCRELQRQTKTLKDENVLRLKEEEEKRREISSQFNTTLTEISRLMEENTQKNNKLREENQNMADRLKSLIDHNDKREDHIEKVLKQREVESQLAVAKMSKFHLEFNEQKEIMLREKKELLQEIASYQLKMQQMSTNEISLRNQLKGYSEKYEEFQSTLDKSNKLFKSFKGEMDEMSKSIKRHEKETRVWREKWENANKALLKMVTERSTMESKLEAQNRQNTRLQSLCRALQQQLAECRQKMKAEEGVESTSTEKISEDCTDALSNMDINVQRCDPCPLDCKSNRHDTTSEDENLECSNTLATNNEEKDKVQGDGNSSNGTCDQVESNFDNQSDGKLDMDAVD